MSTTAIKVDREALARRVADAFTAAFAKLAEYKADIEQLWQEFESLEPGETIMGCGTKTEFCQRVLHRSLRAVQYMLGGGNPGNRSRREIISRAVEPTTSLNEPIIWGGWVLKDNWNGDIVLRAMCNEQNRIFHDLVDGIFRSKDEEFEALRQLASLEGKIVARITAPDDPPEEEEEEDDF